MNKKLAKKRHAKRIGAIIKRVAEAKGRLRLRIRKTLHHTYAQVTTPDGSKTFTSASTLDPMLREQLSYTGNIIAAQAVGKLIAERVLAAGLSKKISFDRAGNLYHGRVKALAEAAREEGLEF